MFLSRRNGIVATVVTEYMKKASGQDSHLGASDACTLQRRKSPKQARSAVTVEAIFDATIQVLLAVGPARLNTTRVAHRAGVSVGTLYQYFPNKQALLLAVLERHLAMLAEAVEQACSEHLGKDVGAMAEGVATAYLRAKAKQQEASRALYLIVIELHADASVATATRRAEDAIRVMLLSVGPDVFTEPVIIAQTLLAAISGAVRTFYEQGRPPAVGGNIERELVAMCRSYLVDATQARTEDLGLQPNIC